MTTPSLENAFIDSLAARLPRSPLQLNRCHESDAELLRLPGSDFVLALTTDGVVEEIETGLYRDPYLVGWMTVVVNASDLAAVGADPIGILLSQTFATDHDQAFVERLQQGVEAAATACKLPVLGGDVNYAIRTQMVGCALGLVADGQPLRRRGCAVGDLLFATHRLGAGTAFALTQLEADRTGSRSTVDYRPLARLAEGQHLRRFATSCMDTSDGVLATLAQLGELNSVGFEFHQPVSEVVSANARLIAEAAQIPPWMLLAGPHGEFELLFTIPPGRREEFLTAASDQEWLPLELGRVMPSPGVRLQADGAREALDGGEVRNLFLEVRGDVERYIAELMRIHERLSLS